MQTVITVSIGKKKYTALIRRGKDAEYVRLAKMQLKQEHAHKFQVREDIDYYLATNTEAADKFRQGETLIL